MNKRIDIKRLLILSFTFILFTAIGTVSHEYGHIIIAESLGYDTTLHYGSMNYNNSHLSDELYEIYNNNKTEINNGADFDKKAEYKNLIEKLTTDDFLITLGGPLQSTITGTIGLLILLWRRKKIRFNRLKSNDWLAVFFSLFWLREVFNLVMFVGNEIMSPNGNYFGGDEKIISEFLKLGSGTFSIILGIIGFAVSLIVILRFVPNRLRLTFILSGLIGGILGYILWMNILGPKLLP